MGQFFSPLLGGFRQGYSTQHVLLNLLQRCKNTIDNKGLAGALAMNLSKGCESVNNNLIIANLNAYGLNLDALQVNNTFSDWKEINFGGTSEDSSRAFTV